MTKHCIFLWIWFTQCNFLRQATVAWNVFAWINNQTVIYIELILLFYRFIHELALIPNSWNMATRYHQRTSPKDAMFGVLKEITKGKLESLLEHFMATFGVISFIILGKTEDSRNFTTSYSLKSSLRHRKGYLEVLGV